MKSRLRSIFIKEQKRYSFGNLKEMFHLQEHDVLSIINRLKSLGVLKSVKNNDEQRKMTELIDEDVEVSDVDSDDSNHLYVFTFVGILMVYGIVLKCYPKYIHMNDAPTRELKQVIKVINKFNKKEQIIKFQNDMQGEAKFNRLAVILYLLNDFYENGVYQSSRSISEVNGTGEINWERTINDTFAIISNNRPVYPELITKRSINDEYNYIKRLHETILTQCSKEIEDSGLLELFDILDVNLSDEKIEGFGDTEYILNHIQKELNVQYNTHKQLLLKTLYTFVANEGVLSDNSEFSLFGTNSFHVVWEKSCAEVLDNHLETPLEQLPLNLSSTFSRQRNKTLKEFIEKPKWHGKGIEIQEAEKTLIPDLITIKKNIKGDWQFLIFDAKYYNLRLEKGILDGQPGIESITKQYLYQMAYQDFLGEHCIQEVRNCFLFPTECDDVIDNGEVYMDMFSNLEKIKIRMLPVSRVYDCYLNNKKIDVTELDL